MSFFIADNVRKKLYARGIFPVVGKIDFEVLESLLDFVLRNREEKKPITVLINSSGGNPTPVQHFRSLLNVVGSDVKLRGVAFGECGSSALALLQCCTVRYGIEGCGFFIHNMQFMPKLDCALFDEELFRDEFERTKKLEAEMIDLQCRRSGISEEEWRNLARLGSKMSGRAIFCTEAKELGLIDRVRRRFPVF